MNISGKQKEHMVLLASLPAIKHLERCFCLYCRLLHHLPEHSVIANSVNTSQNSSSIFTCLYVCMYVFKRDISIYLHCMMFQTIQTIYFLKAHHLVMIMTETKSYKKTNTKTKTQTKTETNCFQYLFYIIYFSKAGGSSI